MAVCTVVVRVSCDLSKVSRTGIVLGTDHTDSMIVFYSKLVEQSC